MDKTHLIQKVKSIEGLSNEERSALLDIINTKKRYGLVWEEKPEEVEELLRQNLPILKEVTEKRITRVIETTPVVKNAELFETENNNEDRIFTPNHVLIEGDNLHALTALSFTHENKIDVIYIDPPYNTGNNDFTYQDKFKDEPEFITKEHPFRHSTWISFIHKRLIIAKRLLNEKGIIFISIDDNEQSQLKLLCDEVFTENNFIGAIVWFKKRKGSFLSNQLVSLTEYILPYRKNKPIMLFGGNPDNSESQPIVKRTNSRKTLNFKENLVRTKLKDGIYKKGIYGVGSSASNLINDFEVKDNLIISEFSIEAPFVWSQDFLDAEIENGTEIIINTINLQVRVIRHNNDSIKAMPSFIDGREIGATNEDAYELLKSMFNSDRLFSYSKPVNLVKKIIESASYFNKSAIILDFFAGSGTTLHATMQLNNEDGGNRQCILVTNNENNICEDVTYVRNKKVIEGYTNNSDEFISGLAKNNLRYYKTEFIPSLRTETNKRLLTQSSTDLLCIKEDCYTELTEDTGFNIKQCRIFTNDAGKYLIIVYHSRQQIQVCEQLAEYIKTLNGLSEKVRLYGFSPEKETLTEDFIEVADKIEAVPLPEAIYNAYRATFKAIKLDKKQPVSFVEPNAEINFNEVEAEN